VASGEHKPLRAALDMMETERSKASVVAAKLATTALVADHLRLESRAVYATV
jgi:hypothetical protein